ncbi:MAG: ribonuclease HII [Desulfobacteraceae bacterium IS3]|nr:MAG: ribonuclease HII [Desulfobacteraceae bacterium IS3]
MEPDLWKFEKDAWQKGFSRVAGIDEAGRGPLAGPVVSAAVILPQGFSIQVRDSKTLSSKQRDNFYDKIYAHALCVGIGMADAAEIDRINILKASLLSMRLALENLKLQPDYLLIDGQFPIASALPQKPVIKGDSLSMSISAASIIAKVTRDRLMDKYHKDYPQFGFSKHKGYPTKAHKDAIRKFGICPIHRLTFKGVKEYAQQISEIR